MNKKLALGAAIGVLGAFGSQAAFDGTVRMSDASGTGGNFLATILTGQNSAPFGLASVKTGTLPGSGSTSFLTFCVETDEFMQFGSGDYDVEVSQSSDTGGRRGPSPDPISLATAWLYSNFIAGTLDDNTAAASRYQYTYNETGAGHLQNAIWFLEQELPDSTSPELLLPPSNQSRDLIRFAMLATGTIIAGVNPTAEEYDTAQNTNADGAFGVHVLRMYNGLPGGNGAFNQDILVVVPEPSTYIAGGLALIPLLFGLRTRLGKK
jgi:hypothetical protein